MGRRDQRGNGVSGAPARSVQARDDPGTRHLAERGRRGRRPPGRQAARTLVRSSMVPEHYADGNTIYHRLPRIAGPSSSRLMPLEERRNLLDMIMSRHWKHDGSGFLLMGWMALGPFCGALDWRPHVWITGTKGCGKTKIIELFVLPLSGRHGAVGSGAHDRGGDKAGAKTRRPAGDLRRDGGYDARVTGGRSTSVGTRTVGICADWTNHQGDASTVGP